MFFWSHVDLAFFFAWCECTIKLWQFWWTWCILTDITDVRIVSIAGFVRHSVVAFPVHDTTVLNTPYIIRLIPRPQGKITCTKVYKQSKCYRWFPTEFFTISISAKCGWSDRFKGEIPVFGFAGIEYYWGTKILARARSGRQIYHICLSWKSSSRNPFDQKLNVLGVYTNENVFVSHIWN